MMLSKSEAKSIMDGLERPMERQSTNELCMAAAARLGDEVRQKKQKPKKDDISVDHLTLPSTVLTSTSSSGPSSGPHHTQVPPARAPASSSTSCVDDTAVYCGSGGHYSSSFCSNDSCNRVQLSLNHHYGNIPSGSCSTTRLFPPSPPPPSPGTFLIDSSEEPIPSEEIIGSITLRPAVQSSPILPIIIIHKPTAVVDTTTDTAGPCTVMNCGQETRNTYNQPTSLEDVPMMATQGGFGLSPEYLKPDGVGNNMVELADLSHYGNRPYCHAPTSVVLLPRAASFLLPPSAGNGPNISPIPPQHGEVTRSPAYQSTQHREVTQNPAYQSTQHGEVTQSPAYQSTQQSLPYVTALGSPLSVPCHQPSPSYYSANLITASPNTTPDGNTVVTLQPSTPRTTSKAVAVINTVVHEVPQTRSYFIISILLTLLCCLLDPIAAVLCGCPALCFSTLAYYYNRTGNYSAAGVHSTIALILNFVTVVMGIILTVVVIVPVIVVLLVILHLSPDYFN